MSLNPTGRQHSKTTETTVVAQVALTVPTPYAKKKSSGEWEVSVVVTTVFLRKWEWQKGHLAWNSMDVEASIMLYHENTKH